MALSLQRSHTITFSPNHLKSSCQSAIYQMQWQPSFCSFLYSSDRFQCTKRSKQYPAKVVKRRAGRAQETFLRLHIFCNSDITLVLNMQTPLTTKKCRQLFHVFPKTANLLNLTWAVVAHIAGRIREAFCTNNKSSGKHE